MVLAFGKPADYAVGPDSGLTRLCREAGRQA
jgi:hypothetical protein